jgi:predicted nuclease of predicted toxin-antitoxin system
MKLLLDENLPGRLKEDFPEHSVFTVREMGWNGLRDSALLSKASSTGFRVLLTFDKNIRFQQNFSRFSIAVFILTAKNNTYRELTKLSPLVQRLLKQKLRPEPVAIYEGMSA